MHFLGGMYRGLEDEEEMEYNVSHLPRLMFVQVGLMDIPYGSEQTRRELPEK